MAEPPGILCQGRNPVNINDGTMCAQKTPKPGITGERHWWDSAWDETVSDVAWMAGSVRDGTAAAYHGLTWAGGELWEGTKWAGSEVWSGVEWTGVEIASGVKWSWGEIRGGAVWLGNKVYDAYKYLRTLFNKILNAANWDILKVIAEPILGQSFMQAGLLWGIVESLGKDILSLLQVGKMVALAGCYELMIHPDVATTLALNPSTMPMVLTALALKAVSHEIPDLADQMKKSDEQLKKMVTDLWKVVSHWDDFLAFVKALGKQLKQGTIDDFNKLKYYAQHRSLSGDFETGKIFGRALYQIIMLILIFVSGVGAVRSAVRFLSRVPALLKTAEIIRIGGPVEDIIETERIVKGARTADEIAEAERVPRKPVEPEKSVRDLEPEPKPLRTEVRNGYKYTFDDSGRVTRVEGDLTSNPAQGRNAKAQLEAGGPDRLSSDEGGHFVGRRFDGPRDAFNHFAQDMNFNRSAYKKLENVWQRALDNGSSVHVDIQPNYVGDSLRLQSLDVNYTIDDIPYQKTFVNQSGRE